MSSASHPRPRSAAAAAVRAAGHRSPRPPFSAEPLEPRTLMTAIIFNGVDSAKPGDVFGLQGHDFGTNPQVFVDRVGDAAAAVSVPTISRSTTYASARIPPNMGTGLYEVWVSNGTATSAKWAVNRARPTTVEFDQIAANTRFRVWGRNLNVGGTAPSARLVDAATGTSYPLTVQGGDAYELTVVAPANLPASGTFDLYVANGHGGTTYEAKCDDRLTARAGGTDPFGLRTPWAVDFATLATRTFDVKAGYGAAGNGTTNDYAAITNAITAATAAGGGVVYFPAGTYLVDTTALSAFGVGSNVVFRGALSGGNPAATLKFTTPGNAVANDSGGNSLWGVLDLKFDGRGLRTGGSRVFVKNVEVNMGVGSVTEAIYLSGKNMLVVDSTFKHLVSEPTEAPKNPIYVAPGSSYYQVRSNAITYWESRLNSAGSNHGIWEDNRFTRDASNQNYANKGEAGGIEHSGVGDLVIQGNTFDVINGTLDRTRNEGETLLSQPNDTPVTVNSVEYKVNDVGTATGSSAANTMEDTNNTFFTLRQLSTTGVVLAIVDGPGAGQWRRIVSNTSTQITVDRNWDVRPVAGQSRYTVTRWANTGGTTQAILRGNILVGNNRGIQYFSGGNDVAIVGNRMTDSDGINVKGDDRSSYASDGAGRVNPAWNFVVEDNVVRSTTGRVPAHISVFATAVQSDTFGVALLNNRVANNFVDGYVDADGNNPSINGNRYGNHDGYWNFLHYNNPANDLPMDEEPTPDTVTQGIVGTIFQGNTANDITYTVYNGVRSAAGAYRTGTGAYHTTIWDAVRNNAALAVKDTSAPGVSQKSVGTNLEILPGPWLDADVGAVALNGRATESAGTYTLEAGGADIYGTADQFHFAYRPIEGDTEVIARVTGVENTNSWAKAGVMIRDSLTAGSENAAIFITPGNGATFQYRATTGGTTTGATRTGITAPYWVRLVRTGSTVTGYVSSTGAAGSWTTVGSATVSMAGRLYVGLAATSHNAGALATATFTNVSATTAISIATRSTVGKIDAESYSSMSGVISDGDKVGYADSGDWLRFDDVDFGAGRREFQARLSAFYSGRSIEVRLGSTTGTLVGTLGVTGTGGYGNYLMQYAALSQEVVGIHHVYLVFQGGSGVANLDWFRFV